MSLPDRERARAKVNLNLHVTGRDAEGYHLLETLMLMADGAEDFVTLEGVGERDTLSVEGPFASGLDDDDDNLILKATARAREVSPDLPPLRWRLEKHLPIASGIGGGSADAGAALRLIGRHFDVAPAILEQIAESLGADVPVAFGDRAAWATRRGDILTPLDVRAVSAVLVNPAVPCSTPAVFAAYRREDPGFSPSVQEPNGDLSSWVSTVRNDLTDAAVNVAPAIRSALDALLSIEDCRLARMSGSGATCFGLFDDDSCATKASATLQAAHPDWWIKAVRLT